MASPEPELLPLMFLAYGFSRRTQIATATDRTPPQAELLADAVA